MVTKNHKNCHRYYSEKFRQWKIFAKCIETSHFWNIKVALFRISNPDSIRVKFFLTYFLGSKMVEYCFLYTFQTFNQMYVDTSWSESLRLIIWNIFIVQKVCTKHFCWESFSIVFLIFLRKLILSLIITFFK